MDDNSFKLFSLIVTTVTALVSALGLAYIGMKTAEANRIAADAKAGAEAAQKQTTAAVQQVRTTLSTTANETKEAAEKVVTTLAQTSDENKAATQQVVTTLAQANDSTQQRLDELRVTTGNSQRMGEAIHTLVNSNMSAQLAISSAALRRIADLTQDPRDTEIARQAQDLFNEHVAKQSEVDRRPPPTATADGRGTGVPAAMAHELDQQRMPTGAGVPVLPPRNPHPNADMRTVGILQHQADMLVTPRQTQGDRVEKAVEKNIGLTQRAGESAEGARLEAADIHTALDELKDGLRGVKTEQERVKGELAENGGTPATTTTEPEERAD